MTIPPKEETIRTRARIRVEGERTIGDPMVTEEEMVTVIKVETIVTTPKIVTKTIGTTATTEIVAVLVTGITKIEKPEIGITKIGITKIEIIKIEIIKIGIIRIGIKIEKKIARTKSEKIKIARTKNEKIKNGRTRNVRIESVNVPETTHVKIEIVTTRKKIPKTIGTTKIVTRLIVIIEIEIVI